MLSTQYAGQMNSDVPVCNRDVVFISKATPGDDEFVLWLAPKLEAEGYSVFADILSLEPGDRWRKIVTNTLQDRAIKMLLCCTDSSLAKDGVQDEIGIAIDLAKSLNDPKFIIPLRLESFRKLFGIGELQYIDFVRGWASGLSKVLEALKRQRVPRSSDISINPNWELYRRRLAVQLRQEPEPLISNWLRIVEIPEKIKFFEPTGATDQIALSQRSRSVAFPAHHHRHGILSFAETSEINDAFAGVGRFSEAKNIEAISFIRHGWEELDIDAYDASNITNAMFRQAWDTYCRSHGLLEYCYSKGTGFHASEQLVSIGKKISWGKQGQRRSSMLRNIAQGHVWQFGISASPAFWPFPHFKLKSRVLFGPVSEGQPGQVYMETRKQHRLRRTVCKGWRNKQWYGRMMAYLEALSGDSAFLMLPLAKQSYVKLDALPMVFTSPVSTELPNEMTDESEEEDESTLGRPDSEEEP